MKFCQRNCRLVHASTTIDGDCRRAARDIGHVATALAVCLLFAGSLAAQDDQHETTAHDEFPPNRLADETSPYLLQHAHNPVRWQPWDETALKQAVDENKVIFLSIGYSSCHWCHVMERESFMDEEIAAILNEHFVCIKVDREERPDVDTIYMTSLNIYNQLTTGRAGGGWPLSMFLTPDGKPFFGGTYFPARDGDRAGSPGFLTVLNRVMAAWDRSRDRVKQDAERLTEFTRAELDGQREGDGGEIQPEWTQRCLETLADQFDERYGGFGFSDANPGIPKFPDASRLMFLLDQCAAAAEDSPAHTSARTMLTATLDKMHEGGIYDHVGGGFHRYSVDRYWYVPHFEKMLYDNGQLLSVYSRAWKLTGEARYRDVARGIATFVQREMTTPEGGFVAALDAESEGVEGKFYVWEKSELEQAIDADTFPFFANVYGLHGAPQLEGKYHVLRIARPVAEVAREMGQEPARIEELLAAARETLLQLRDGRARPLTDTKILTSWNGLMIRGLADAGRLLEEPQWHDLASRAAEFVWDELYVDGRLRRTSTAGQSRFNAYLDDYAFFIDALIALHEADGDGKWLERAVELQTVQDELFWDEAHSGYYFTSSDHESLLARTSDPTDGATPSGSSVAARNLLYLADALDRAELRERARKVVSGSSGLIEDFPSAAPRLLIAARLLL